MHPAAAAAAASIRGISISISISSNNINNQTKSRRNKSNSLTVIESSSQIKSSYLSSLFVCWWITMLCYAS
jgi:hypothetical protein